MDADRRMTHRPPRLNPFVFPSDTSFRFILLIVSVLGASLLIYSALYNSIPANREYIRVYQGQCTAVTRAAYPTNSLEDMFARGFAFSQCTTPLKHTQAAWVISGVVLLLVVAGIIYWIFPKWKIWRDKLEPLNAQDAPEMVPYLAELCREAGLTSPPVFLLNPLNRASSGLAFGRLGRYYIVLNGGLVTRFYTDRPAFRAVVLHELAHLYNADVDKTYFSLAIGLAFLVAALVPLAISQFGRPLDETFNIGWRVLALTMLVYLTLSAVLRAREVYADVRASVWDGLAGGLGRMLNSLPQPKGGRWRRYAAFHPDPDDRRKALNETQHLFRMGFWEALGTGIAATIAFENVDSALLGPFVPASDSFLSVLGTGLIFAPLMVGVVGSGIWRANLAALANKRVLQGIGRLGLGLGLGFLLGQYLSLSAYALSKSQQSLTGLDLFVFDALWIGVVLASLLLFLYWINAGASTWMEVAAASRSPRPAYRVGLIIAGIWLTLWLGLLFYVYPSRATGNDMLIPTLIARISTQYNVSMTGALFLLIEATITAVLSNPLALFAFISIWAFPLAAWFWRKRIVSTSRSSWAFLDPTPLTLPRQYPLRPGLALAIGMAGGVISCVFLLMLGFVLHSTLTDVEYFNWILIWQPVIAAVMQAVVAAIVASMVRRLGSLHGLFAAFVAGCVISLGAIANLLLYLPGIGQDLLLQSSWLFFTKVVNEGALLALPIALVASALAGWLRQITASNPKKTLTTFCEALRRQDYHTVYNQLSNPQQVTEAQFTSQFGAFIARNGGLNAYAVSDIAEENSSAIGAMRLTLGNGKTQNFSCTLVDASGKWRISFIGPPHQAQQSLARISAR